MRSILHLFRDRMEADAGIRLLPAPAVSMNITGFYRWNTGQSVGANQNSDGVAVGVSFFF